MQIKDVIIAGAGPAGLICAMKFAQAGFSVTVFEAEASIPENLRGSTFHPSSLDMLEQAFGAATPLIERGLMAPKVQYRRHGRGRIAEFDFADIADLTAHPFRLQVEQYKLCQILRDKLAEFPNAELAYNASVTDVRQNDATVTISVNGGDMEAAGSYLIGADGANSVVRRASNIAFDGFTWPERFLVVSTPFDFMTAIPDLASVSYIADAQEWYFLLKLRNFWRVMFPTNQDEPDQQVLSDQAVQARLRRVHDKGSAYDIAHKTLYKVHQRVADTYRLGRILLTGDAAHINNPLGGMGMNGGIHDSFNLSDKLIAVIRDHADPALLDRYTEERRTMALDYVQKVSIQNKKDLEAKDAAAQKAFEDRLRQAEKDPRERRQHLLRLAMLTSHGPAVASTRD